MTAIPVYGSLFLSAFLSATLLPGSSEALLTGYVATENGAIWLLVLSALTGNVLGSIVNWILGRYLSHFRDRKWFPIKASMYEKSTDWFRRYGKWSLLMSWAPIVGDPLTIAAGVLRTPLLPFIVLVTIGKLARYLFVLQAALILFGN
ncbi:MAG: DedA family protein [Proteobacteria bacterium]|nr:DedA family protein [Pseudomonadota bacterium]